MLIAEYPTASAKHQPKQAGRDSQPRKPCSCAHSTLAPPARLDYRNQVIPHDVRLQPLKLANIHFGPAAWRQPSSGQRVQNDRDPEFSVEKHLNICLNRGPNQPTIHHQDSQNSVQSPQPDNQPWISVPHKFHTHDHWFAHRMSCSSSLPRRIRYIKNIVAT